MIEFIATIVLVFFTGIFWYKLGHKKGFQQGSEVAGNAIHDMIICDMKQVGDSSTLPQYCRQMESNGKPFPKNEV